jgi:hypothetical protein
LPLTFECIADRCSSVDNTIPKDIGSKLNGLENLGLDFYRKLAGTTIFMKTTLIEGGQQVFSGAISGLETVGGNIAEAAKKKLLKMLENGLAILVESFNQDLEESLVNLEVINLFSKCKL